MRDLSELQSLLFYFENNRQYKIPEIEYRKAKQRFQDGHYRHSVRTLDKIIAEPNKKISASKSTLHDVLVLYAWNYFELRNMEFCRTILDFYRRTEANHTKNTEIILIGLWLSHFDGEYEKVIEVSTKFVDEYSTSLNSSIGGFLFVRGSAYECIGEYSLAFDDYESAQTIFKLIGMKKDQGEACNSCARALIVQSCYQETENWLKRSKKIFKSLQLNWRYGYGCMNLGITYYKTGYYQKAAEELETAEILLLEEGDEINHCRTRIARGNVFRLLRNFTDAKTLLLHSFQVASKKRWCREECLSLEFLGATYLDNGKVDEADRYLSRCLAIAKRINHKNDLISSILRRKGEILIVKKNYPDAISILRRAKSLSEEQEDHNENGIVLRCISDCMVGIGDLKSAKEYIEKAIEQFQNTNVGHKLGVAHLRASSIFWELGESKENGSSTFRLVDRAWEHALAAHAWFIKLNLPHHQTQSQKLLSRIGQRRVEEARYRQSTVPGKSGNNEFKPQSGIIAVSEPMKEVLRICDAFAPYREAVLVTGATGTGKDLIARRIHDKSDRAGKPFVAVNVTAIPETMFEREFFGHCKGAFSGAEKDVPGYAAQANGGTLFLDEIGDMPRETQPKLLRLLENGTYKQLGSPGEEHTDIRLVAATNSNLHELVESGKFREDLYFRLQILEIDLPPLKKRIDDIMPLLEHFLSISAGRQARVAEFFNEPSIEAMLGYEWPGNVREIAMVASRAHISLKATGRVLVEAGFKPNVLVVTGPDLAANAAAAGGDDTPELSRSRILLALDETDGNRAEAARRLGISRATLYRRLEQFNIS